MVTNFRSRPVGWRGESYRHYLASKGIATRKYNAYKGFSRSEVADLENFFESHPRLKLKRDKGVSLIVKSDDPEVVRKGDHIGHEFHAGEFSRSSIGFGDGKRFDNIPVLTISDVSDKGTLVHELEHATQSRKIPEASLARLERTQQFRKVIASEVGDGEEITNMLSDVATGDELVAHEREERFIREHPEFPNTYGVPIARVVNDIKSSSETDDLTESAKFLVAEGEVDKQRIHEQLRSSPTLKSFDNEWWPHEE